ncbi:hypothetical protein D3C86_1232750 [compost metagenome]
MGHGRGPGPAARPDKGDGATNEGLGRVGEQAANGRDQLQGLNRRDQILADAAPHQLAEQQDVVGGPDDDHLGPRVTDLGQLVNLGQQGLSVLHALDDDQGRRRLRLVGLDGGGDPADADLGRGPRHAPILTGPLGGRQGVLTFSEDVHGDARDRHLDRPARRHRQTGRLIGRQAGRHHGGFLGGIGRKDLIRNHGRNSRRHDGGSHRRFGLRNQLAHGVVGLADRGLRRGHRPWHWGEGRGRARGRDGIDELIVHVERVQSVEILCGERLAHVNQSTASEIRVPATRASRAEDVVSPLP